MGRYSTRELPPHPFVPGATSRPPGEGRDRPAPWRPEEWRGLESWLWAVDLFNHEYWWECHEVLEGLWLAAGRTSPHARFVQSIVHLSAACLNARRGHASASRRQAARAVRGLRSARSRGRVVMGIEVERLAADVVRAFAREGASPADLRITLVER